MKWKIIGTYFEARKINMLETEGLQNSSHPSPYSLGNENENG
jgi:hypothetical protein